MCLKRVSSSLSKNWNGPTKFHGNWTWMKRSTPRYETIIERGCIRDETRARSQHSRITSKPPRYNTLTINELSMERNDRRRSTTPTDRSLQQLWFPSANGNIRLPDAATPLREFLLISSYQAGTKNNFRSSIAAGTRSFSRRFANISRHG